VEIGEVDPFDDDQVAAWHAVYERSQSHDRAFPSPWRLPEAEAALRDPGRRRRIVALSGRVDGAVVCSGAIRLPQLESAADGQSATAAFAIVRDRDPGSGRVTVWVSSRVTATTTVRRMVPEGGDVDRSATRLAVESVELIRASLAGLWPSPPAARPPETFTPAAATGPRVAVALSVGRMTDFGDAPGLWAPQLAASWGGYDGIGVRVTASGFGPGADVSSDMGGVHIRRTIVTLGLVRSLRSDRTVQPTFGIAAGVNRLAVHGTWPPERAHDPSAFSALAMASVGIAVALGPRVAAIAEADATIVWPASKVRIGAADVAIFDGLTLFTHVGLRATF